MRATRTQTSTFAFLAMAILCGGLAWSQSSPSWGDNLSDGVRDSASTSTSNPGRLAYDGDPGTFWQLAADKTDGWTERYWSTTQSLSGAQVTADVPAGASLRFSVLSKNQWLALPGTRIDGPVSGTVRLTFPGEIAPTTRVLVALSGAQAAQAKVWNVTFTPKTYPATYGKILPKTYSFNQSEYINVSPSRLWDGIKSNAWYEPLWSFPFEPFQTNSQNRPDSIFPPYFGNPPKNAEIIWELDGSKTIKELKAYFSTGWRFVRFEFWNGTAWTQGQTLSSGPSDSGWERFDLPSPVTTSRIRITFPNGWEGARFTNEIEVWGDGENDFDPLTLPAGAATASGDYHLTVNSAEVRDNDIEVSVAGLRSTPIAGQWNGDDFSHAPTTWIGGDTVYRLSFDRTTLRPDTQFLKLSGIGASLKSVTLRRHFDNGQIDLGWPYSDGQFEYTSPSVSGPAPSLKTKQWNLSDTYQLERLRVYSKNGIQPTFKTLLGNKWTPVSWKTQGSGWWEADLNGALAQAIAYDAPSPITLDEVQLYGTPLNDTRVGMEIWWPRPGSVVTSSDYDSNSVIGWMGDPSVQTLIGNYHPRQQDRLFWLPLNQMGLLSGEEGIFNLNGKLNGAVYNKIFHILWQGSKPEATLDQGISLASLNAGTITLSGTVNNKNYRVFVNGVETPVSAQTSKFSTNVTLADGFQILNVEVWDKQKNKLKISFQKPVYRTVGTPLIELALPRGDLWSQSSNLTLSGFAGNGTSLSLTVNGTPATLNGNTFSQTLNLTEGNQAIQLVLKDNAGRQTQSTLNIYRDTAAPQISIVTPTPNQYIASSTFNFSVSGAPDKDLWWAFNSEPWAFASGTTRTKLYTLADGFYTFKAQAQDRSGNLSQVASVAFVIDPTKPLPFAITSNVSGWTSNTRPIITFATTDATSGIDHYEYVIDGGAFTAITSPFQLPVLADGVRTIYVKAVDKAGNFQLSSIQLFIDTSTPPTPIDFRPVSGPDKVTVKWTGVDDNESFQTYRVERNPAWPDGVRTVNDGAYGARSYADTGLARGTTYSYRVWAVDRAGNASAKTDWQDVVVGLEDTPVTTNQATVAEYQDATLTVPAGGLDPEVVSVQMNEVPLDAINHKPENPLLSTIYQFRVTRTNSSGTTVGTHADLLQDATIKIGFDPSALPAGMNVNNVKPFYYDDLWGRWIQVPGGIVDFNSNSVSFTTNHFSDYSLQATKATDLTPDQIRDVQFSPFASNTKHDPVNVSVEGGSVSTSFTELVLPGKNGLDLVLKRVYDTGTSQSDGADTDLVPAPSPSASPSASPGASPSPSTSPSPTPSPQPHTNGDTPWFMGQGWRLDFPSMKWNASGLWVKGLDGQSLNFGQMAMSQSGDNNNGTLTVHMVNHESSDVSMDLTFASTTQYFYLFGILPIQTGVSHQLSSAVLNMKDGRKVEFDTKGRVTKIYDNNRINHIDFEYGSDGKATKITDTMGREVSFGYDGKKINSISVKAAADAYQTPVSYNYDGVKLAHATDVGGRQWNYTYEDKVLNSNSVLQNPPSGYNYKAPDPQATHVAALATVSGPGIGKTTVTYQTKDSESFDYSDSPWTYKITSQRLFAQTLTVSLPDDSQKRVTTYDYTITPQDAFGKYTYTSKSVSSDGRLTRTNTYSSVSKTRNSLSIAPEALRSSLGLVVGTRQDLTEIVTKLNTIDTYDTLGAHVDKTDQTWDESTMRMTQTKSVKASTDGNFSQIDYGYDGWGNITSQTETSQVAGRKSYRKTVSTFYSTGSLFSPTNLSSPIGSPTLSEPSLSFERHDLLAARSVEIQGWRSAYAGQSPDVDTFEKSYNLYNPIGQLINSNVWTGTAWAQSTYTYDTNGELSQATGPAPHSQVTNYTWDYDFGLHQNEYRLTTTQVGVKQADGTTRDIFTAVGYRRLTGTQTWSQNARGYATEMTYDALGRVTSITEPGDSDAVTDGSGNITLFPNRPVVDRSSTSPHTTVSYDDAALTVDVKKDPNQARTVYTFNQLGQLSTIQKYNNAMSPLQGSGGSSASSETITTQLEYDGFGQVTALRGPVSTLDIGRTLANLVTTFSYDTQGRVTSTKLAGATNTRTTTYDDTTNTVTSYNELGNRTLQVTDWNGKTLEQGVYVGGVLQSSKTYYDGAGRPIAQIDPKGSVSTTTYNERGQVVSQKLPVRDVTVNGVTNSVTPEVLTSYDDAGFLIQTSQVLDAGGTRMVTNAVNGLGQVLTTTSPVDNAATPKSLVVTTVYDRAGNTLSQSTQYSGAGEKVSTKSFTYDAHNRVLTETVTFDGETHTTSYEYDKAGNKTKVTDPRQGLYPGRFYMTMEYDQLNRLIRGTLPSVDTAQLPTVEFLYDGRGNLLKQKNANGQLTSYSYNLRNLVSTQTATDGTVNLTTTTNYDDAGRAISAQSPSGRIVYTQYDEAGRVILQGNDGSGYTSIEYDANGNKIKVTDGRGDATTSTYNVDNQPVSVTDAKQKTSTVSYDRWNQKTKTTDAEQNVRTYTYDRIGRLLTETIPWTSANGPQYSYSYDARGNVIGLTDPNGTSFARTYNAYSLLLSETATNGVRSETTTYTYDESGAIKTSNNGVPVSYNTANGVYHPNPYSLITNRTATVGGNPLSMSYSYDASQRLTGVTYPNNKSVSYGYNGFDQVTSMSDWVNGALNYNPTTGQLSNYTLGNGVKRSFSYDSEDRLAGMGYSTGSTNLKSYAFTYDKAANIASKTEDGNTNQYAYDELNQLIQANMNGWFQMKPEQLNPSFATSDRDYTGSAILSFTVQPTDSVILDTASRSVGVDLGGIYGINKIELHPSNATHRVRAEDLSLYISSSNNDDPDSYVKVNDWKFENTNGVLTITLKSIVQARFLKVNTIWDDRDIDNNSVTDGSTFSNTAKDLVKVWTLKTFKVEQYAYDDNGNRVTLTVDGLPSNYQYYKNVNAGNLERIKFDGTWYYTYDNNGNTTAKAKALLGNGAVDTAQEYWTFGWDLHNRLISASKGGTVLVSYAYDSDNFRVSRTEGTRTTIYAYGRQGALAYQKNLSDNTERTFAYLSNQLVGWIDTTASGTPVAVDTRYYVTTDHEGSVTQVISSDSSDPKVLWESEYDPFGTVSGADGKFAFDGMYTGKDSDPVTGLIYSWNRWQNPETGRFMSEDPARDGGNWYGYGSENPLTFTDPSGLETEGGGDNTAPRTKADIVSDLLNGKIDYGTYLKQVGHLSQQQHDFANAILKGNLAQYPELQKALVEKFGEKTTDASVVLNFYGGMLEGYNGDIARLVDAIVSGKVFDEFASRSREFLKDPGAYLGGLFDSIGAAVSGGMDNYVDQQLAYKFGNANTKANMLGQIFGQVLGTVAESALGEGIGEAAGLFTRAAFKGGSTLGGLQSKLEELAESNLLPKFREIDPDLKAGYTGSFKTGFVGNPSKPTFGQPIDLKNFDIDYWIKSPVLSKMFGGNLRAAPEFRALLSRTPGFEGLKPNKQGFSIKFRED